MNRVKQQTIDLQAQVIKGSFLCLLSLMLLFAAVSINRAHAQANEIHPLINKLWSVEDSKFIEVETLRERVLKSDHVILGETHDNIDHHRIQAKILNWFVAEKQPISTVFEMLSDEQLDPLQKMSFSTSDSFFDKVSWEESGWPNRKFYKPIFDIVIEEKLPIYGAETNRNLLMKLTKGGEENLPADIAVDLKKVVLDESAKKQLKEEIVASHCGMLPEKMVEPMILGQRVRDVVMAKSLLGAAENGTAILFAGSGHGRNDFGVPAYVKGQDEKAVISTIAMMEVVDEVVDPTEYSEAWASDKIPFDFVWFTNRMERGDPCEELRQHFKKHPV